jgi:hypothetical protein
VPDLATFQLAFAGALSRTSRRGTLERQPGLAVYRNTAAIGLIDALRAAYPVTAEIVGTEAFDALAHDFARAHPPASPVLLHYGAGFAGFLAAQPWTSELPYLAGVAELERLASEAHVAADAEPLRFADLAALGAETWMALRLPLHPATRFAWLRTPAMTIWLAHRDPAGFDSLAPEWRAEGGLFTRPADAVEAVLIDAPAHRLLSGLRLGESVGEAARAVADIYPESDFPELFARLVNRGAFARPRHLERT